MLRWPGRNRMSQGSGASVLPETAPAFELFLLQIFIGIKKVWVFFRHAVVKTKLFKLFIQQFHENMT